MFKILIFLEDWEMERKCVCGRSKQIYQLVRKYCLVGERQFYYKQLKRHYFDMNLEDMSKMLQFDLNSKTLQEEYSWSC